MLNSASNSRGEVGFGWEGEKEYCVGVKSLSCLSVCIITRRKSPRRRRRKLRGLGGEIDRRKRK